MLSCGQCNCTVVQSNRDNASAKVFSADGAIRIASGCQRKQLGSGAVSRGGWRANECFVSQPCEGYGIIGMDMDCSMLPVGGPLRKSVSDCKYFKDIDVRIALLWGGDAA
jgi:hypothetical protein